MSFEAELKAEKCREKRLMKRQVRGRETLASEIASLSKLGIDELRERWKAMFGKAPSRDISRSFLTRAIAYRLQEKAFGGLKPSTRRVLAEFAHDGADERRLRHRLASCGPARCWCVNGAVSAIK